MAHLTESTVELSGLPWLAELGWIVKHGADISPGGDHLSGVVLAQCLSEDKRWKYGLPPLESLRLFLEKGLIWKTAR